MKQIENEMGVRPTSYSALDPRQSRFIELYLDVKSKTFGNCYQSAIGAGFTDQTARNLTHNKPRWYSETLGQMTLMEPTHLLLKLQEIISNPAETTQNRLRAIDMMMKHNQMYGGSINVSQQNLHITIESVLE